MPHAPGSPRRRVTLWVPVVVSAIVQLSATAWLVRVLDPGPASTITTFALAAVGPLALVWARRWPGPVVAIVTAAAVAMLLVGINGGPPPAALAFAVVGAVVRGARVWAWVSLAFGWLLALLIVLNAPPVGWSPPRIVGTTFGLLVLLGMGEFIRTRRERQREDEAELARRRATAADEERARIARELHDVLAHSLSQINVQAGVGLHLADAHPEKAAEALASIRAVSKQALDEVRGVLGILRDDAEAPLTPQPGIGDVRALVDAVQLPDVVVTLDHRAPDLEVPGPVGAAAYRIVQEALTNVARHAHGATSADVLIEGEPGRLRISVHDDGVPVAGSPEPGRGLTGMRERCEQLGGDVAWRRDSDGFTIRAEIPWEASA
ncbi:sensor histidine kinase [Salinibacterium sp. ZJ77]|uniref:sensor histidine kinase n=1 Tax=Salinibacterium sp. ZJ77 TaxID=2708337 RepID=UPI001421EBC4|nr:sensor histidine kinase [Salinibacterium sp. ZJ77]